MKQDKVLVVCPRCGHSQHEPAAAYSSNCKKCRHYFRLEDVLRDSAKTEKPEATRPGTTRALRRVTCFQCGTELEVSPTAQSTMCKRCSSHLDLRDYIITSAVSKNFRTRGRFVVEEGGYVFNTETVVADAVIKGRFLGKLVAERSLEIHRHAEIKGTFNTGQLIIPATSVFRWPDVLNIGGADIAGELIATVRSSGRVTLRATARLFGDVEAAGLEVEAGAIVMGTMRIRPNRPPPAPAPSPVRAPAPAPVRPASSARAGSGRRSPGRRAEG
jgi:cytoskeletal protein CcmA (bactofilin family)